MAKPQAAKTCTGLLPLNVFLIYRHVQGQRVFIFPKGRKTTEREGMSAHPASATWIFRKVALSLVIGFNGDE